MWIVAGFAALGLLLGNLIGLTSESAVNPLVSLLFVFVGGSVFAFLHKLNSNDRAIAGGSVMTLSMFCLLGVYFAIWTNQHRWLTPATVRAAQISQASNEPYLRSAVMTEADLVDRKKEQGAIGADEAYAQMSRLVRQCAAEADTGKEKK